MKGNARLYKGIKFVLLGAVVAWLVHFFFFTRTGVRLIHSNVQQLSEELQSFGAYAVILGMLAVVIQTILPFVPFVLVAGANVLAFGFLKGFFINYSMAVLGAMIAFCLGRYYGHGWVERKLSKFPIVQQFSQKMEKQGFFYVLIARMIPVLPSTAISLAAGTTKVKTSHFFAATAIGKLPMILLESLIGHDLLHFRRYRIRLLILVLIFVLLMAIGSWLKSKMTRKARETESDS